jgi:hypothetical protein
MRNARTPRNTKAGYSPHFPALNEWQKMSESEQGTLINKMEAVRRQNSRIFIALAQLLGLQSRRRYLRLVGFEGRLRQSSTIVVE